MAPITCESIKFWIEGQVHYAPPSVHRVVQAAKEKVKVLPQLARSGGDLLRIKRRRLVADSSMRDVKRHRSSGCAVLKESRGSQTGPTAIPKLPVESARSFPVPWGVRHPSSSGASNPASRRRSSIEDLCDSVFSDETEMLMDDVFTKDESDASPENVEGVVASRPRKGQRDVSTNTMNITRFFFQSPPPRRLSWNDARRQWQRPTAASPRIHDSLTNFQ